MKLPALVDMLKNGVHFGHRTSKRHPKMNPYIFQARSGIHIIDLEKTQTKLQEAMDFITEIIMRGGTILLVGTKWQAKPLIEKYAKEVGMPYATHRWVGGTITNFDVISQVIKKLKKLKQQEISGGFEKYTKKERAGLKHDIERMELSVGGIQTLEKIPDAIFVVDIKNERIAIDEANKKNVPIIALCDTNVNPTKVAYPIPANDDAIKAIDLILNVIAQTIAAAQKEAAKASKKVAEVKPEAITSEKKAEPKKAAVKKTVAKKVVAKKVEKESVSTATEK